MRIRRALAVGVAGAALAMGVACSSMIEAELAQVSCTR